MPVRLLLPPPTGKHHRRSPVSRLAHAVQHRIGRVTLGLLALGAALTVANVVILLVALI